MALALTKCLDGVHERGLTLGEEQDPVLSFLGAVEVSVADVELGARFPALLAYHVMYGKVHGCRVRVSTMSGSSMKRTFGARTVIRGTSFSPSCSSNSSRCNDRINA